MHPESRIAPVAIAIAVHHANRSMSGQARSTHGGWVERERYPIDKP